jgi:CubicO group peptidase (beta-lactamase class C family)
MLASSLRRIAGLVLALALPVGASAIELRDEFRAAIEQGIANGRYQSIAVGLLDNGEQSQWLFGAVEPGGAKPTADTVYEIGSTTRCFTGLLLADAVLARKLRLDDTLGKIFTDIRFADPKLAATTLGEIAAHRAGLPAIASNLFPRSVDDPYVTFDAAALNAYLAHAHVEGAGTYRYSELGVALLGEAVARA